MANVGPAERKSTPTIEPEPNDQWKAGLRARIQRNLLPMVKDAEENLAKELNNGPINDSRRQALHDAHAEAMNEIRRMAQETYNTELERERQERLWMGGQTIKDEWVDVLAKQQQAIMDEIKEKTARSRSNTLEEERKESTSVSGSVAPPPRASQPLPQRKVEPVAIPYPARTVGPVNPSISPSDSMKGATTHRRPSNMSDRHPRPFRDGPPRADSGGDETIVIRNTPYIPNPSISPAESMRSVPVQRRPSQMSDHNPRPFRNGRPRGDSGSASEDQVARRVPAEAPPTADAVYGPGYVGRQRQGSAGSGRSLGDGSLDRWLPHPNPDDTSSLVRRPSSVEKPMVNGRSAAAQGWRPTLNAEDKYTSSRTFDIARTDTNNTGEPANLLIVDEPEADAVAQEWSRVSKGKARRHDRGKQRTGPSSPSLLEPPRPAASQQVSLVEVRRTSASPILDAVELPLVRPIPSRRPSVRIRSRSPLGVYADGSRSPPNGPPAGFQPLVAPYEPRGQPHPLLMRPPMINPSASARTDMGPPPRRVPSESNISTSRPLVRRRSFSGGESPLSPTAESRDWYPAPRASPMPGDDVRYEQQPIPVPWGRPSPAANVSPNSPGWNPLESAPGAALSGKFRRGSSSSLRMADDGRPSGSPTAGASSSRPIALAKKRSTNLRDDMDGPGGSASSPRTRGWYGPEPIPEDGRLDFPASSPPYRDEGPRAGAGSRSGSLRSRGSRDFRPGAQDVFAFGSRRRPSYNLGEQLSDEGSDDDYGGDRRSVRSLELDEALRREKEAKRREDEAQKKEEEALRKEEEAMRKEEEARKEKEEARRRDDDARRREEENRRKEEEVRKEREEVRRREEEVKRKEEETKLHMVEARKKEEEVRRKEEEAMVQVQEVRRKEEEVKRKEADAKRKEQEVMRKEEEAKRKEEEAKRIREEARKQQADARRQIDDAKRDAKRKLEDAAREAKSKEEDARRQLEDAKREAKRREEDFERREQELARWEEELTRRDAIQKREKELMQREELLRQREEMQRRKEALEREKAEDEDARRLEEELRLQELEEEEEERRRQEDLLRIHEEQQQHEELLRRAQEEEEEARQMDLIRVMEAEEQERELELLRQEEDRQHELLRIAQEEEDARRREALRQDSIRRTREEEEARRAEQFRKAQADAQMKRDEELARRLSEEEEQTRRAATQRKAQAEELRKQELALHKQRAQEAERQRRDQGAWRTHEDEQKRREDDFRRRQLDEQARREEEARRVQAEHLRKVQDEERVRREKLAEDDYFRFEEEYRRRSGDRTRHDSTGSVASAGAAAASVPRPIPARAVPAANGIPIPGDRTSTGSSNWSGASTSASAWSASTRATTATAASTARPPNFPSAGTTPPSAPLPRPAASASAVPNVAPSFGASPSSAGRSAPPLSEAEWVRRQAEQAKKQQEAFRREQERQEREKQTKAARAFTREDIVQVFQKHDQQWLLVRSAPKLRWETFPWPVFKKPTTPEELTTDAVSAYVLSPHHPTDTAKSNKDRVKDHIKRWHPDRFDTQLLPKVNDEEKERVKEGAGWVARALNDILTRINSPGFFD